MNPLRALVMAGGRSERMRSTLGPRHKAMVEVAGTTLLERNLSVLLSAGIHEITVAVGGYEDELNAFVRERGEALARRYGAVIDTFVEERPLGNIGAVGVMGRDGDTLVVFVDNLTSLDVNALIEHHRQTQAALTLATHVWPLANPFGELEIDDGLVRAYREKPVRSVRIASGLYVVSPSAAALIPADRPFGASELVAALLERGERVAAFQHAEPWIDINDAASVTAAERLLRENAEAFARADPSR